MSTSHKYDTEQWQERRDAQVGAFLRRSQFLIERLERSGMEQRVIYEVRVQRRGAEWLVILKMRDEGEYKVPFQTLSSLEQLGKVVLNVLEGKVKVAEDKYPPNGSWAKPPKSTIDEPF